MLVEANTITMDVELHGQINFKEDDYLWRYLDTRKFLYLVENKKLWFSRLDAFDDPLEGLTNRTIEDIAHYDTLDKLINNPGRFKKELIASKKQESEFLKERIEKESKVSRTTQFASCWYTGRKESYAMWNLYSNSESVVLKYKPNALLDILIPVAESYRDENFGKFLYGHIVYKEVWPFNYFEKEDDKKVEFSAYKKDTSYEHEREFRFVVVARKEKVAAFDKFELPLGEISMDDFEIVASPYMTNEQYENVDAKLAENKMDGKLSRSLLKVKMI